MMVITVISVLSFGGFASDGWKGCFQALETMLLMGGRRLSAGRKSDRESYGKKMRERTDGQLNSFIFANRNIGYRIISIIYIIIYIILIY